MEYLNVIMFEMLFMFYDVELKCLHVGIVPEKKQVKAFQVWILSICLQETTFNTGTVQPHFTNEAGMLSCDKYSKMFKSKQGLLIPNNETHQIHQIFGWKTKCSITIYVFSLSYQLLCLFHLLLLQKIPGLSIFYIYFV